MVFQVWVPLTLQGELLKAVSCTTSNEHCPFLQVEATPSMAVPGQVGIEGVILERFCACASLPIPTPYPQYRRVVHLMEWMRTWEVEVPYNAVIV